MVFLILNWIVEGLANLSMWSGLERIAKLRKNEGSRKPTWIAFGLLLGPPAIFGLVLALVKI